MLEKLFFGFTVLIVASLIATVVYPVIVLALMALGLPDDAIPAVYIMVSIGSMVAAYNTM